MALWSNRPGQPLSSHFVKQKQKEAPCHRWPGAGFISISLGSDVGVGNEFPIMIESSESVDEAVVGHLRHQLVTKFIGKLPKKLLPISVRWRGWIEAVIRRLQWDAPSRL
jgi:hypothetical protein